METTGEEGVQEQSVSGAVEQYLRANAGEPMAASEVAEAVGCVRRTAHKHLTRLVDDAAVESKKVGARARVFWLPASNDEVYERITDAFFAVDTRWCFTHLNAQAEQLLGRSADDLVGKPLWAEFPEAADSTFGAEYRRAMETQESVSFEEYYPPLDTHFAVEAYPSPTGLSVYFRDITERIDHERDLRARVHQQRVVAQLGQWALEPTDVDTFMHEVCETVADTLDTTYCKVLDLDPETERLVLRQGVGWDEGIVGTATVPANTNSQAGYTLQQRAPVRVEELSTETRFSGPDLLTDHDVESGISVIVGSVEEPWGILGAHDTESRSFTEQDADFVRSVATLLASALERHEYERELERYETVFETVSDGVYTVDPDGTFTLVNEAYVQMTGIARSELVGSHVSQLVGDEVRERAKKLETQLVQGEREQATLEAELTNAAGETFPAEATFSLLETGEGYERIAVVRDITERKRREEVLEEERDRVERLNRLALRVFDAIRGVMDAETRDGIAQAVCDRLVDGDTYDEAAIGSPTWQAATVTTGTGTAWSTTGWRGHVPDVVDRATDASDGVAVADSIAALALTYDDRTFGVLVVHAERLAGLGAHERSFLTELATAVGLAISAVERKNVLVNDAVATLEFESASLAEPFTDVVGTDTAFEFVVDRIVPVTDEIYVAHYSVDGIPAERFVSAVESFESVVEAQVVDSDETGCRVRVHLSDTAVVTQFRRFDGRVRSFRVDDGALSLTVDVPVANVREAVDAVVERYPDLDLRAQRATHRKSRTPTEFRALVDDQLTERQQAALELAYFGGYFEWPRTTDGEALSETMGITPPTFHKHLRLAHRQVLGALYRQ